MGAKNNVVAIWLGYFNSKEEFEEFTRVHYELSETSKDISEVNSLFDNVFKLGKYNREIVEKEIQSNCMSCYELLKNASYLSEYAKSLSREMSNYNCVIFIYDYHYDCEVGAYHNHGNSMDFFANLEYEKDDDVSIWVKRARERMLKMKNESEANR